MRQNLLYFIYHLDYFPLESQWISIPKSTPLWAITP